MQRTPWDKEKTKEIDNPFTIGIEYKFNNAVVRNAWRFSSVGLINFASNVSGRDEKMLKMIIRGIWRRKRDKFLLKTIRNESGVFYLLLACITYANLFLLW